MKLSIVTVVKNNERTIRHAIESTLSQKGVDLEYIVIDGKSTDKTLGIITEYKDRIDVLVSESDKSLYHALNKAVSLATGDVVGILHSDDIYASESVLAEVMQKFEEGCDIVYGDLAIVRSDDINRVIRYWHSADYSKYKIYFGWMPPHPSFFVKRSLYEKYGSFDTTIKISADYDLMLRFMTAKDVKPCYIKKLIVKMRAGGASNNSFYNIIRKMKDDYRVVKKHNLAGLFTVLMKKVTKLHQFFLITARKKDSTE